MKLKLKVYKEHGTLVGVLPSGCTSMSVGGEKVHRAKNPRDGRLAPFRLALKKAQMQGLRKKEIFESVQDEFLNERKEILSAEDYKLLMKKEINKVFIKFVREIESHNLY